ncbi:MAG: hypothetical protein GF398_04155 [Chitinivibrionales bacterium]|nr:hypothetical protein [Chitinivibrionales bacterium]
MKDKTRRIIDKVNYPKFVIELTVFVFLATCFFGLKPKGFRLVNKAVILENPSRLAFQGIGMAYSRDDLSALDLKDSVAITLDVKSRGFHRKVGSIFSILADDNSPKLQLVQWHSMLVIHMLKENKSLKAGADNILIKDSVRTITLAGTRNFTSIYLNDSLCTTRKNLTLLDQEGKLSGKLLIGNSALGDNTFRGEIYRIRIDNHIQSKYPPKALYSFARVRKKVIHNEAGKEFPLILPELFKAKRLIFFNFSPLRFKYTISYISDIVINFFGFFPFGFCMYLLFSLLGVRPEWQLLLLATSASLGSSMMFEFVQAFLPTRSSQLIDVALNMIGGGCGAILGQMVASGGQKCRGQK